jgi:hypothetical protein
LTRVSSAPFLFFLEAFYYHFAAELWEVVDEEFAVAVVGFVEEAAGGVACGFAFEPFAAEVLSAEANNFGANYDGRNLAYGKAAFLAALLAFAVDNLGVCRYELYALTVHNKQAKVKAYLRRGEADAFGVVHCVVHIGAEAFKLFAKVGDGHSNLREDGFRIFGYLAN